MSNDFNKVIIVGRLGHDPDARFSPSGVAVTKFSIAVKKISKSQDGNKNESTMWVNIVAFKGLAEICSKWLKKGSQVLIDGELSIRKYQDKKTGQEKYATEVIANNMQMIGSKSNGPDKNGSGNRRVASPAPPEKQIEINDDIPF